MRDLLSVLGIDRVTVVGHSLGGGVAAQFAYTFPERCERLVLVGTGGIARSVSVLLRLAAAPNADLLMPTLGSPVVKRSARLVAQLLRLLGTDLGRDTEEILKVFDSLPDATARRAILRTLRSGVDWRGQVITMLDRAYLAEGMPTLVLWGAHDAIIPVEHAHLAAAAMPGSHLEIFEDAGHFPHHTDPERFVAVIRAFLEATAPSRSSLTSGASGFAGASRCGPSSGLATSMARCQGASAAAPKGATRHVEFRVCSPRAVTTALTRAKASRRATWVGWRVGRQPLTTTGSATRRSAVRRCLRRGADHGRQDPWRALRAHRRTGPRRRQDQGSATGPPRRPRTRLSTAHWAMACLVSVVAEPIWGTMITLGACTSGSSGRGGSSCSTSRAAPAIRPASSASVNAPWSTTEPRAVLTRKAVGFIGGQCVRADEVARARIEVDVHGHEISLAQPLGELPHAIDAGDTRQVGPGIDVAHAHPRRQRPCGHGLPDAAEPHEEQDLPRQVATERNVVPVPARRRPHRLGDATGEHGQEGHGQVRHGVAQHRCDRDQDPSTTGGVEIDVVQPHAHGADHPQARRPGQDLSVDKDVGAHEQAVGLGQGATEGSRVGASGAQDGEVTPCQLVQKRRGEGHGDHRLRARRRPRHR